MVPRLTDLRRIDATTLAALAPVHQARGRVPCSDRLAELFFAGHLPTYRHQMCGDATHLGTFTLVRFRDTDDTEHAALFERGPGSHRLRTWAIGPVDAVQHLWTDLQQLTDVVLDATSGRYPETAAARALRLAKLYADTLYETEPHAPEPAPADDGPEATAFRVARRTAARHACDLSAGEMYVTRTRELATASATAALAALTALRAVHPAAPTPREARTPAALARDAHAYRQLTQTAQPEATLVDTAEWRQPARALATPRRPTPAATPYLRALP